MQHPAGLQHQLAAAHSSRPLLLGGRLPARPTATPGATAPSSSGRRSVLARVSEIRKPRKKGGLFGGGFGPGSAAGSSRDEDSEEAAAVTEQAAAAPPAEAPAAPAAAPLETAAATAVEEATSAKLAVAARISAARALARKLAEEKQAAIAAARQVSQHVGDPEAAKQMKEAAEAEVAELARAAARADSIARAAARAESGAQQLLEIQRLKAENEALQELLLQMAADKAEAQQKVAELQALIRSPAEAAANLDLALDELTERAAAAPTAAEAAVIEAEAVRAAAEKAEREAQRREAERKALEEASSLEQIRQLAQRANQDNKAVFTVPPPPVKVGGLVRVYYNRIKGPIPPHGPQLVFKVGLNKWEIIEERPMTRVEQLNDKGEWWSVDYNLPEDVFKVDYVFMDSKSGVVDNNGGRDFQGQITGGPTESELQLRRMAAYEVAEKQRMKELAAEEERIYADVIAQAQELSLAARENFRLRKQQELLREAQAAVAERRGRAVTQLQAVASKPGVFAWVGGGPEAGTASCLVYNKAKGPLRNTSAVLAHVGYDGWWLKDKRVMRMEKLDSDRVAAYGLEAGEWWAAQVPVWSTAAVVDFVFSDDRQAAWDNAGGFDYHTLVQSAPSGERLVELVYDALAEAEAEEIAQAEEAAAQRVIAKAHVKALAARKRRERQARFLYTKPLTPVAGQPVEVYYNPDHTVLNGRPEVYVAGGWNRYSHPAAFKPTPMEPVMRGGLGFLKATLQVPSDAHVMDLVFLDSRDSHGGFYDNNKGVDYHIPVVGGTGTMPNLKVVHIAVEMAPIAKAGGLGDVVTALGRAVQDEGHEVEVIMPKYDCIDYGQVAGLSVVKEFPMAGTQVKVWKGVVEGLRTTFLEPCNGLFWQGRIYTDMNQDKRRFGFFCDASLEYIRHHSDRRADILHCHDWQTAPIAFANRGGSKCAFTIHNLNYGADLIGKAMGAADVCTTVSPTYAQEISGHPAIAPHHDKFYGIVNGIDPEIWDPLQDRFLPRGYDSRTVVEGKAAAKQELRKRMNLSQVDVPLVGCVTRLTHQKGIHLIKHAAWRTMERGGQFVLLGSAPDPKVQAEFEQLAADLAQQYPDRAHLWFAYDEPLSHLIYAGSDLFLVPSMFEPCGLTQMIAMRYGAIPVVRRTGGLNDTVFDIDHDAERAAAVGMEVNGFNFEGMDTPGMDYALNRALTRWFEDRQWWNQLARRVMELDWSWSAPALDYIELYYKALKRKP